jgi:hypothetical protein
MGDGVIGTSCPERQQWQAVAVNHSPAVTRQVARAPRPPERDRRVGVCQLLESWWRSAPFGQQVARQLERASIHSKLPGVGDSSQRGRLQTQALVIVGVGEYSTARLKCDESGRLSLDRHRAQLREPLVGQKSIGAVVQLALDRAKPDQRGCADRGFSRFSKCVIQVGRRVQIVALKLSDLSF